MADTPTVLVFDIGGELRSSPPLFFNAHVDVPPEDLTRFTPNNSGVYGFQDNNPVNPFAMAPSEEPCGGVTFFDDGVDRNDFFAMLKLLKIDRPHALRQDQYCTITASSEEPKKDGYLTQMRIVTKYALRHLFNSLDERGYENFPKQEMTLAEALWAFIESESKRWNVQGHAYSPRLAGRFGGDNDYMREALCFGLMIENSYHEVYRIWSRAWLVTK